MELLLNSRQVVLIDDSDLPLIKAFKWYVRGNGKKFYAHTKIGKSSLSMHRLLLAPTPQMEVDHVNGNGLDNRRKNIRICTVSQNRQNTSGWGKRHSKSIQGHPIYKGVYRISVNSGRHGGKIWEARLCWEGKQRVIGIFDLPELAAMAHDDWARTFHGRFARLNFPEKDEMGVHDTNGGLQ